VLVFAGPKDGFLLADAMCWSAEVSVITAAAEWLVILLIYRRRRYKTDRWILPTLVTIAGVETIEAAMWLFGDLERWSDRQAEGCSATNSLLTKAVWLLLRTQLWAFMTALRNTGREDNRVRYELLEVMSVAWGIVSVMLTLDALLGLEPWSKRVDFDGVSANGREFCTYITSYIHWVVPAPVSVNRPNAFMYFLFLFTGAVWHRPFFECGLPYLALLAVVVALGAVLKSASAYSVWCWAAVSVFPYYLLAPARLGFTTLPQDSVSKGVNEGRDRPCLEGALDKTA